MTVVNVSAGACGFVTRISACKEDRRSVRISLESQCEAIQALDRVLQRHGPLSLRDIVSKGTGNRVLMAGAEVVSHASCPVLVAIIKAAEVELGLNVPTPVTIEFE
jgi:hypothetical protein